MKHYDKKPVTSGSIQGAVNGKFGIPSQSLIQSIKNCTMSTHIETTQGSGMDKPKSSWSCSQNSPPQVVRGQSYERNA
mgnify:CR=1 FL=1